MLRLLEYGGGSGGGFWRHGRAERAQFRHEVADGLAHGRGLLRDAIGAVADGGEATGVEIGVQEALQIVQVGLHGREAGGDFETDVPHRVELALEFQLARLTAGADGFVLDRGEFFIPVVEVNFATAGEREVGLMHLVRERTELADGSGEAIKLRAQVRLRVVDETVQLGHGGVHLSASLFDLVREGLQGRDGAFTGAITGAGATGDQDGETHV